MEKLKACDSIRDFRLFIIKISWDLNGISKNDCSNMKKNLGNNKG